MLVRVRLNATHGDQRLGVWPHAQPVQGSLVATQHNRLRVCLCGGRGGGIPINTVPTIASHKMPPTGLEAPLRHPNLTPNALAHLHGTIQRALGSHPDTVRVRKRTAPSNTPPTAPPPPAQLRSRLTHCHHLHPSPPLACLCCHHRRHHCLAAPYGGAMCHCVHRRQGHHACHCHPSGASPKAGL